ncbi:Dynamin-related protein 5a [Thalictrum thalictroides]|uniref:Dynamin-related protein 5a n=1 Tax=Thalictrum thalictroides TaxID=46969 RepID=A0A7J6WSH4_THATH|nr:Dynamin-related protein 5a [Thalictrum thalictroides]
MGSTTTTTNTFLTTTPSKTPNTRSHRKHQQEQQHISMDSSSSTQSNAEFKSRFEAFNRLQAVAVAFGEKLPIPEIVALGGQSDGKSSLLEALLGFRFNIREVEMGTRRPLILQMVHDQSALEPRCRFQDEESEEYGSPMMLASAIADQIKFRTESLLRKTRTAVSSKPIVMRAEYAHCPNLTIIDTPGFVLKAKKGEPENTPDEILSMVKSLASPPHRLLLFLQQSSVEWCSSLWLDAIREIDPSFKRTLIVVSKFDNRLKEFTEKWEVDRYLSASGYLGDNTHPFFVALPKDRGTISNEEFRRQISQVDTEVLRHLREGVNGGFDEDKFRPFIGFGRLKDYLEEELQKRYKEAAPATLALLEQRCDEVSIDLGRMDSKIRATSDVAHLRRSAMVHAASISGHIGALVNGAADPDPEQWGKTTNEEQSESDVGSWPGVANILLAHAGRGGGGGITEAAAEIARAAARSWLAPLLDTSCDRLAYVLVNLFDLAIERNRSRDSLSYGKNGADMEGYIGFHAALRSSYNRFIKDLAKQCKQLVRHHLDSVTSPYSQVCYDNDFVGGLGSTSIRFNQAQVSPFCLELSDGRATCIDDQENVPPERSGQQITPVKTTEGKEVLGESQMTVPETPSPDQPCDAAYAALKKKDNGNCIENVVGRKRQSRMTTVGKNMDHNLRQTGGGSLLFGNNDVSSKSGSAYAYTCSAAAQQFAKIREVLIERLVPSTLNSGFLTPCRDRLVVALGLDLFAVNDEKFMDMFVAPGALDVLQNERHSLHKRQKILQSCLHEFKNIARAL